MAIAPGSTLVNSLLPQTRSRNIQLLIDALLIIGFSLFVALGAQLSFHIPTTPVPITFQTLALLLTGAALGSKRGGLALLLYLAEGLVGLPVFAGFSGGAHVLVGFTAGYLWAYPLAAFITGWLCERSLDRNILTAMLAMVPGSLLIYIVGLSWFLYFFHLTLWVGLSQAVIPFLLGDLIKILIAALLLPAAWRLIAFAHRRRS